MNGTKVKKDELLAIMRTNRDAHWAVFEKALLACREDILATLDRELQRAREGHPIRVSYHFPRPEDHPPDYDRVIRMLEMSVQQVIDLDEEDFARYVMDDWEWKRMWAANAYVSGVSGPTGASGASGTSGILGEEFLA